MPDPLIHVGYHKTGSTWLQTRIFSDAQLGFVKTPTPVVIDEAFVSVNPFAFDPEIARSRFATLLEEARARDCVPVITHERLSGDIETGGIDSRDIADRLAAAFPNGRVLIVIREQRDMLLSIHKTELTFGTYRIGRRWRERTVIERRSAAPTLDHFAYHHLISYYQRVFDPDRVLVLPFESLKADPLGFVSDVSKFCGVAVPTHVPLDRANESLPALLLELNRWFNKAMRALGLGDTWFEGPLEERLAKRVQLKILGRLAPLFPNAVSRPIEQRWRDEIERTVGDRFVESNRATSRITGLDLGALGYMLEPQP
jgi:hypothetical protein